MKKESKRYELTEKQIWIGIVIVSLLLFGLKQYNQINEVEVNNLIQDELTAGNSNEI